MAINLKPIEQIADKWARRAGAAGPDYTAGVKAPGKDWAAETGAAETAYEQGVQEAIGRKAFGREVRKAGSAKWQAKAADVGAPRYPTGITASKADFNAGFAPFASVIQAVSLPSKGPRGAAANIERVRAVADALHNKRVAGAS